MIDSPGRPCPGLYSHYTLNIERASGRGSAPGRAAGAAPPRVVEIASILSGVHRLERLPFARAAFPAGAKELAILVGDIAAATPQIEGRIAIGARLPPA